MHHCICNKQMLMIRREASHASAVLAAGVYSSLVFLISIITVLQVRKLFQQLFSFVNVQLFNQLLLRRECCSFSNGEYVKTGLAEVENWIHSAGKDWTGESWDELRYIRQVCVCCSICWCSISVHAAESRASRARMNDHCLLLY